MAYIHVSGSFQCLAHSAHSMQEKLVTEKLFSGRKNKYERMSSQDLRAHRDKIYNGKTGFVCNLSQNWGCFWTCRMRVSSRASLLAICKVALSQIWQANQLYANRTECRANPLDLTCFKVSSCWLCLLSGYFSVSSSSCGCFTDPSPCVRLLLFSKRLHWHLSQNV